MVSIHAVMIVIAYLVSVVIPAYSDLLLFWGFLLLVVFRVVLGYRFTDSLANGYTRSFDEFDIPKVNSRVKGVKEEVKSSSSGKAIVS